MYIYIQRIAILLSIVVIAISTSFTPAAVAAEEQFSILEKGKAHFLGRRFIKAAEILLTVDAKSNEAAEALFIAGCAYNQLSDNRAETVLRNVMNDYQNSNYRAQAAFVLTERFISTKRWKEAAKILHDERKRLTDPARVIALAEKYAKQGQEAMDKARKLQDRLDSISLNLNEEKRETYKKKISDMYAKADNSLFLAWHSGGIKAGEDKLLLNLINVCRALGKKTDAAKYYSRFISKYPDHEKYESILLAYVKLLKSRQREEARKLLAKFIKEHSESKSIPMAILLDVKIARADGEDVKDRLAWYVKEYPDSPCRKEALIALVDFLLEKKDAREAGKYITALIKDNPKSDLLPRLTLAMIGVWNNKANYGEVIKSSEMYLRLFPKSPGWNSVQEMLKKAHLGIAKQHSEQNDYALALKKYRRFIELYPNSSERAQAEFQCAGMLENMNKTAEAAEACELLFSRNPESPVSMQAFKKFRELIRKEPKGFQKLIQVTDRMSQLKKELPVAREAKRLLEDLRSVKLSASTTQTYLTSEPAIVTVFTRNIREMDWQLHELDMDVFFRKHSTIASAGALDTHFIPAQKSGVLAAKDYTPLKDTRTEFSLGLLPAGAYVLTLTSEHRYTRTLVIVSDMACVIKTEPGQTRILAIDMKQNRPVEGATILVAHPSGVSSSGKTGKDGVLVLPEEFHKKYQKNFLAVKDRHIAFGSAGEPAEGGNKWTGSRIFIATDRPVYKPGDEVNMWMLARWKTDGMYSVLANKSLTVTIMNPERREIVSEAVNTDDLGASDFTFRLDEDPTPGAYLINVMCRHKKTVRAFSCVFRVETYSKPPISVEAELISPEKNTPNTTELTIRFTAKYQSGIPAAGKKLRFTVNSMLSRFPETPSSEADKLFKSRFIRASWQIRRYLRKSFEVTTGSDGTGKITIPAKSYSRVMKLFIDGHIVQDTTTSGRNIGFTAEIPINVPDAYVVASCLSKSPVAGETVQIAVSTFEEDGTRKVMKGKLIVYRHAAGGRIQVSEIPVTTRSGSDELVKYIFSNDGYYKLEFMPESGKVIQGRSYISVDKKEKKKDLSLPVEFDKPSYQIGDEMTLAIEAPPGERLALLTLEAEKIHFWKTVLLKGGKQEIKLTVKSEYQPNVYATLSAPSSSGLYTGSKMAFVLPVMRISITPDKRAYLPGEKVTLKIKTTDENGKPLSAAMSLAIVDEAIFRVQKSNVESIRSFYYPERRDNYIRTGSTCRCNISPVAGTINNLFYSELLRRKRLEKEGLPPIHPHLALLASENKNLNSTSVVDAYGVGGGAAGAYGQRWGRGGSAGTEMAYMRDTRKVFPDTAYWNPGIRTSSDGLAEVSFTAPDTLTEWRITAYGASAATAVGEMQGSIRTEKPVAAFISTPSFLRAGDNSAASAWIGNFTADALSCRLRVQSMKQLINETVLPGTGAVSMFLLQAGLGGITEFEASVDAGKYSDTVRRKIPVKPSAFRYQTGFAGVLRSRTERKFKLPTGSDIANTTVVITFDQDVSSLAGSALQYLGGYPYGCVEQTLSRFLPWVALGEVRGYTEKAGIAEYNEATKRGISRLCDLQNPDKTWGWWRGQNGDAFTTGYALLGLRMAKDAGFHVPDAVLESGIAVAEVIIAQEGIDGDDLEVDALAFLAYGAGCSPARIEAGNYFELDSCGPAASSLIALAYLDSGNRIKADPCLERIRTSGYEETDGSRIYEGGENRWLDSPTTSTALALLALVKAEGDTDATRKTARGLLSLRNSRTWPSTKDTALAILALGHYFRVARFTAPSQVVTVSVNGIEVGKVDFNKPGSAGKGISLVVTPEMLVGNENLLVISAPGAGEAPYTVTVKTTMDSKLAAGLPDAFDLKSYYYENSPNGKRKPVNSRPPGYSILQYGTFTGIAPNTYMVGSTVNRSIKLTNYQDVSHVIIEEPLLPGLALDEKSISAAGPNAQAFRFEVREDRIVFFITDSTWNNLHITYRCYAAFTGTYTMPPTVAYAMYEPDVYSASRRDVIRIITSDEIKHKTDLMPDELYKIGLKAYDFGNYNESVNRLGVLLKEYRLANQYFRKAATALTLSHLHLGSNKEALALYRQIIQSAGLGYLTNPEEKVLADLLYSEGESRDSAELDKRIIDNAFYEAISLWENMPYEDRYGPGVFMKIVMDYPFRLHQYSDMLVDRELFGGQMFENIGSFGFTPRARCAVEFLEAVALMKRTKSGSRFTETSKAVEIRLRAGDFENGLRMANLYVDAAKGGYDEPEALYFKAYGLFSLDRFAEAAEIATRLTAEKFPTEGWDDTRNRSVDVMKFSPYKHNATHLLAQVAHKTGDYARALELYRKSAKHFPDAVAMIQHLTRQELLAPAKVETSPGDSSEIEVVTRNIQKLSVSIYPLDPVLIYCFRGERVDLASLNLAGLKENRTINVDVPATADLSKSTTKIALPPMKEGASLVIISGGNRTTAVAVCTTKIRIQRCAQGSRLRFIVTDRLTGNGVKGCLVKVFRQKGNTLDFYTDSRGVVLCPNDVPMDAPAIGQFGESFAIDW